MSRDGGGLDGGVEGEDGDALDKESMVSDGSAMAIDVWEDSSRLVVERGKLGKEYKKKIVRIQR